jgi:hypothetical protein
LIIHYLSAKYCKVEKIAFRNLKKEFRKYFLELRKRNIGSSLQCWKRKDINLERGRESTKEKGML